VSSLLVSSSQLRTMLPLPMILRSSLVVGRRWPCVRRQTDRQTDSWRGARGILVTRDTAIPREKSFGSPYYDHQCQEPFKNVDCARFPLTVFFRQRNEERDAPRAHHGAVVSSCGPSQSQKRLERNEAPTARSLPHPSHPPRERGRVARLNVYRGESLSTRRLCSASD
jgi:hypothetical protein